jgi:DNA-directed RNA polymerase subunit E'/Rpb7
MPAYWKVWLHLSMWWVLTSFCECMMSQMQAQDGTRIQEGSEVRIRIVGTKIDESDIVSDVGSG